MLVPTPQSILDDDSVDIFEAAIANTVTNYTDKRAKLWQRYRYTGIGNLDQTYWAQCVADREALIAEEYDLKIQAWEEFRDRIANLGNDDIDISSTQYVDSSNTSTDKVYDPPQNNGALATPTSYLDAQSQSSNVYSESRHGGTETVELKVWKDAIEDPWNDWLREFENLFYWGL